MNVSSDSEKPKISVCVVTYNHEAYIEKCLSSILSQKGEFELEVIIGDDCSTDNTKQLIAKFSDKYPSTIKVINYQKNVGPTENFLNVHSQATGEFVCHCDGDDYWYPNKITTQLNLMIADSSIAQIWHCTYCVDDSNSKIGVFPSRIARILYPESISSSDIALSYALVGHHSSQMYRRKARIFKRRTEVVLDYWIAFNISKNGKSLYLKDILSAYRVTESNSVTRNNSAKRVTVDSLTEHLKDIVQYDQEYETQAASNAYARLIFSRLRGHDLSVIKPFVLLTKNKVKYFQLLKSMWFTSLQKIKL